MIKELTESDESYVVALALIERTIARAVNTFCTYSQWEAGERAFRSKIKSSVLDIPLGSSVSSRSYLSPALTERERVILPAEFSIKIEGAEYDCLQDGYRDLPFKRLFFHLVNPIPLEGRDYVNVGVIVHTGPPVIDSPESNLWVGSFRTLRLRVPAGVPSEVSAELAAR